jgi:hypothetical protein
MSTRDPEIVKILIEHGILPTDRLVKAFGDLVDDAFGEGMDTEYGAWVAKVGLPFV